MILERIEIQGFKSFANRTVLEFPAHGSATPVGGAQDLSGHDQSLRKSITTIVGPNGSGKSNISDAVRWVLGEQSMKNIRGKKSEDIIFSGSDKKARLGFAEVSLYLKNEGEPTKTAQQEQLNEKFEIDPNDFNELVITRRLYRDGQSQYLINRQDARLLDINMLLAKAGFGQKSYQIIGQGTIDSVLLASPAERKEFFDDAVGVKSFQIKREQSLRQMERTEENLWQAEMLLKELEPRMRSLSRQVKRLEQREIVKGELKLVQKKYYGHIFKDLQAALLDSRKQMSEIEPQIATKKSQLEKINQDISRLAQGDTQSEIFNKYQADYQKLVAEKNWLLKEITIIRGKKELAFEKQGQLNLGWLYRREEELKNKIAELEKQVADLNQVNQYKNEKLAEFLAQEKQNTDQIKDIQLKLREYTAKMSDKITVNEWAAKLEEIYKELDEWTHRFSRINDPQDLVELKKQLTTINKHLADLAQKGKNQTNVIQVDQWNAQLTSVADEKERRTPLINNLKIEVGILNEKIQLLQNEQHALTQESTQTKQKIKDEAMPKEDLSSRWAEEEKTLNSQIGILDEKLKTALDLIQNFNIEEQAKKEKMFNLERDYQRTQNETNILQQQINESRITQARIETKKEDVEKEIIHKLGSLEAINQAVILPREQFEPLFANIERLKSQLDMIGGIDPETIKEYGETKERYDFLTKETTDLSGAMDSLEKIILELDEDIKEQFNAQFNKISAEFTKFFKILFGGGQAKITKVETIEEEKPELSINEMAQAGKERFGEGIGEGIGEGGAANQLTESQEEKRESRAKKFWAGTYQGIEIYACPPGKKLTSIGMLSGGERALASLALIAAIVYVNPAPFVVFDEVDAALDEANSHRMTKIIQELSHKTQFLIITHNRSIMHASDVIYGVTMQLDGVSKLLSVKLEEALAKATRL